MRNLLLLSIFLLILIGCSTQTFNNEDVIAVFNGEEIKAQDVLKVNSLEKNYIINYLKDEIIVYEAQELGIKITDAEIEEYKRTVFPSYDLMETHEFLETIGYTEFVEQQATKLGITEKEYFETWFHERYKRSAYREKYLEQKFGEPNVDEFDEWAEKVAEHTNTLFNDYQANEKLIILFN
ncbi:hypothetical protein [Bacillus sp. FJAT-45350]|uniref:hypothetical protein n=1 Tax=Bacillus sp. FJAT-45350 TaxID=2011014 RepID=UPI000BB8E537|nr:hypothetical protein [Bacillus sp. FJAT-45350]